jgi:hypothetical protein
VPDDNEGGSGRAALRITGYHGPSTATKILARF